MINISTSDAVVPSSQTLFPALTSSCEVSYLDEMPFEMSDEYFDAGVNVAEKFGVIVVNGVVQVTFQTFFLAFYVLFMCCQNGCNYYLRLNYNPWIVKHNLHLIYEARSVQTL